MLISELMEILGQAQGAHGDIEVFFDPYDDLNCQFDFATIAENESGKNWVSDGVHKPNTEAMFIPIYKRVD